MIYHAISVNFSQLGLSPLSFRQLGIKMEIDLPAISYSYSKNTTFIILFLIFRLLTLHKKDNIPIYRQIRRFPWGCKLVSWSEDIFIKVFCKITKPFDASILLAINFLDRSSKKNSSWFRVTEKIVIVIYQTIQVNNSSMTVDNCPSLC